MNHFPYVTSKRSDEFGRYFVELFLSREDEVHVLDCMPSGGVRGAIRHTAVIKGGGQPIKQEIEVSKELFRRVNVFDICPEYAVLAQG